MKAITIQFHDKDTTSQEVEEAVQNELKKNDIDLQTIENLDIYYKPETKHIYYVATTYDGRTYRNVEAIKI